MLTGQNMTFDQLAARYGEITAYGYLEHIERAAGLSPKSMMGLTPEKRLALAIHVQDTRQILLLAA